MILAVMADLMFSVRIMDEAKKRGLQLEFVKDEATALAKLDLKPELVILDLNHAAANPIALLRQMQDFDTFGFVSHVQVELRKEAVEAGCKTVVARSAFAQKLPEVLARYAGTETETAVRS